MDMVNNRVSLNEVKKISLEDLLRRELRRIVKLVPMKPVSPVTKILFSILND